MTAHAIQRARERIGLDVTMADLEASLALLGSDPCAVFVRRYDDSSELWIAPLKGVTAGLFVRRSENIVASVIEAARAALPGKRGEYSQKARHALKRKGKFRMRFSRMKKREAMGAE